MSRSPGFDALDYADTKLGVAVVEHMTTGKTLRERLEDAYPEVVAASLFEDALPERLRGKLTAVRVRLQGAGDVCAHLRAASDREVAEIGRLLVGLYIDLHGEHLRESTKETRRLCALTPCT